MKLSLVACLALGLFLLLFFSPESVHEEWQKRLFGLLHELGTALCVSFVVAALFEIYRNVRHEIETLRDVIDLVMAEKITSEVWLDLKDLIEDKNVIRRSAVIRMELERHPELHDHEAVLKVEHQYQLHPLNSKRSTFTISHELDYQFSEPGLGLPGWDLVQVEPETARLDRAEIDLGKSRVQIRVSLQPRGSEDFVFVQTRRREVVHLPGSYNFYAPEFTKGLRLSLIGCPPDIAAEVLVRPHGGGQALHNNDHTWSFDQLIFPGQGIEIKFSHNDILDLDGVARGASVSQPAR
jgi:hypothetical protein